MQYRIQGYDLIRSLAILIIWIGHIAFWETHPVGSLILRTLSPGLTMSLLGFISAVLLTRSEAQSGRFLIKRFTRIYTSLFLCLTAVLIYHSLQGKDILCQHILLHYAGLSWFFGLFTARNQATIGAGLWYITIICFLYVLLPLLREIFAHRRGTLHFVLVVAACTALEFATYGTESFFNLFISFSLGVFLSTKDLLSGLLNLRVPIAGLLAFGLLGICVLATAGIVPFQIRTLLFVFYPIAFVPLCFAASRALPEWAKVSISFFAAASYEFYILHFYFINQGFYDIFPESFGLVLQIILSFTITFACALLLSRLANRLRTIELNYLLAKP